MKIINSKRIKNPELNQDSLLIELEDGNKIFFESYLEAMTKENGEYNYIFKTREYLKNKDKMPEEPEPEITQEEINLEITEIE